MTTSPSVRVKSHFFDLFLTQKRIILTQPDYPDAPQVDIVFSTVLKFSRSETGEGDPSLSLTITAGGNERTMVLAFDGGGGFKPVDERDRVAELVGGFVAEMATPSPAVPAPFVPDMADGGPSPPGVTDGDVPSAPDLVDNEVPSLINPAESEESSLAPPVSVPQESAQKNMPAPEIPPAKPLSPPISGLKADHIIVKGHEFTASLTPETITLIRHENPEASPLTVKRRDISDVFQKESAGGDPSLHIRVRSATGSERTMVLVFSEWYSGGRASERDEWAVALAETAPLDRWCMPPARPDMIMAKEMLLPLRPGPDHLLVNRFPVGLYSVLNAVHRSKLTLVSVRTAEHHP